MTAFSVFVLLVTIINILSWVILFHKFKVKFKTTFSVDKVMQDVNSAIASHIRELNSVTSRNFELADAKIQELKSVTADAERRLGVLKRELDTTERAWEYQKKMAYGQKESAKVLQKEAKKPQQKVSYQNDSHQRELEFTEKAKAELGILPLGEPKEDAVVKIPVIEPEFYKAKDQITVKKDIRQQIKELSRAGLPVEEIASRTGKTVQEVVLILEIS